MQESLQKNGLLIVEGFWDVLRLRELGIASVGIMFDADEKGDEGAKEALWKLSVAGLRTRLVWSRQMFNAKFNGKEPESISQDDLTAIAMHLG